MAEPGALTAALNWYRALPYARQSIGPIDVPTLHVWGTDDVALGSAAAAGTARWVRGPYTFVRLPGIGHWIPETAPAAEPRIRLHDLAGRHRLEEQQARVTT